MSKIRVGIVNYLNTKPLNYGLYQPEMLELIEPVEDYPARLAAALKEGSIDVGLIPVAAIPGLPEYHIIGDYCLGTEGEVATVCLFSEVPMNEIREVYLDYQSRSSVALLKWLLREYWGISPVLKNAEDERFREKIQGTTAGLVIGDRAFVQRRESTFIYDLGTAWRAITGLPFVFAAWISTKPLSAKFVEAFNRANAVGLGKISEIVRNNPYPHYDLHKYYSVNISYHLDDRKRRAMELFLSIIQEQT